MFELYKVIQILQPMRKKNRWLKVTAEHKQFDFYPKMPKNLKNLSLHSFILKQHTPIRFFKTPNVIALV